MRLELFLQPMLIGFVLTVGLCLLFLTVPFFRHRFWRHGQRHRGKETISRLGGSALLLGFMGAVILTEPLVITREILGLLIGGLVVGGVGLWDDFRELSFKAQGFFQVALTALLFIFGIRITTIKNPFGEILVIPNEGVFYILLGFSLLFLWMFLVLNAVNWLDGLDGLLGSVSLITFLSVFFLSLKPEVNQPPVAILAIAGIGIVLGFLLFNIYPARILAGTTGSMFLGFLIAVLSVIAGTKIATSLLVLVLPIADAIWVIGERIHDKVSIFQSDERHLHYKLRMLGWSESRIAWFFSLLTGVIAVIALSTESIGKLVAFLVVLLIIFFLLLFVAEKTKRSKVI